MTETLVSTDWLASHLGQPDLVVFDATKYLPTEPKDAVAEFRAAHLPKARLFDIDAIADPDTDLPHMVPTPGRFARLIGGLGVSNRSFVVFYDQKGLFSAARGWWMLGLFGHDRVAVLNGGLPKWLAEGKPVEIGDAPPAVPETFRPDFRATRLRGIGDILADLTTRRELLLDARPPGRFSAKLPEPRPGMRSGHIPGAVNLPFTELLAADQTMLPLDPLRARLVQAGADGSQPVVTCCGSGVSACILTLAMVRAGLPPGAVYDGSWSEWGSRPDTPVET